jgi:hypothetical protein
MVTRLTGRACARGAALTARARQNCSNSLYFPSLAEGVEGLSREVEVRLTPRTVEVFLKGERIAAHLRSSGNHRHTTVADHMPSSHRRFGSKARTGEVPAIKTVHLDAASSSTEGGFRGLGEGGTIGAPAAIANALADALAPLGAEIFELPMTSERLFRLIEMVKARVQGE